MQHFQKLVSVTCTLTAFAGCTGNDEMLEGKSAPVEVAKTHDELYVLSSAVWNSPHIPVCWETPGNDTEKAWVRDAVLRSWEMETNVSFEGWGTCNASTSSGIRIRTADEWPATYGLGSQLNNRPNGMLLNFWYTFRDGSGRPFGGCLGANREPCTRSIAVHEFGHALGFAHEHNRQDTPSTCTAPPQGTNGNTQVGNWDLMSVMNYCNPLYNGNGNLSATDIAGAQQFYGGPNSISSVAWGPNRLDTFVRGTDLAVHHKYWSGSAWGGFESLGGVITGSPKFASWGPNRLDGLVRGQDGKLYHKYWNGSSWSDWGSWRPPGFQIVGNPALVSWGPNRLDIFMRGADNALYHKAWNGSAWSEPLNLGGQITGEMSAVSWGPNRLDVFWRGADAALWHKAWNGSAWIGPEFLGGILTSSPSAVSWGPNRIDVFARNLSNRLHQRFWNGAAWSPFVALEGVSFTGNPSAVSWGPERIDVFVRGQDGGLHQRFWNGAVWRYAAHGGGLRGSPSAVSWGPDRLDIFMRGTDNALHHRAWNGSVWASDALGGGFL